MAISALSYSDATRSAAPIPAAEREIATVTAEPFFHVSPQPLALEGPAFDRAGNLHFVDIYGGRVLRLSPELQLTTVFTDSTLRPTGIALHKDGRIFVAGVGDFLAGRVIALHPDGRDAADIVSATAGYVPDDLVFDSQGGFYFTDFKGTATEPTGGVHYVTPDFQAIVPLLPGMAAANGVALSPDGKVLWATEFGAGRLHRVDLRDPVTIAPFGATVPYHFIGRAPDSMRVDVDGNVYVALYHQGRVLVFNGNGVPIGQILLPGRDQGRFLKSSSLAFVPGTREIVVVSRDEAGDGGAMIFRAQAFAAGVALYSHQ